MILKIRLLLFALVIVILFCSLGMLTTREGGAQTLFSCADVTEIPTSECEALVAFYNSTNGDNWIEAIVIGAEVVDPRQGWLQTNSPCSWQGVVCSDSSVVELNKSRHRLSGELPSEIGDLTNLTVLGLSGNQFTIIPAEIGDLTNLTVLGLSDIQFTIVPAEIGNLTNLTVLGLSGNQLTIVPAEIGNLTNLTELYLNSNQLTIIPAEIGNLTNLTDLYLQDNQLTIIPAEIGNLTNLTVLYLNSNQLTTLPPEILRLTNLRFQLYTNGLEHDEGVCITAEPAEVDAWRNITEITTLQSCPVNVNATSITINPTQNQATTAPMSVICFILFLIGAYGTHAIMRKQ